MQSQNTPVKKNDVFLPAIIVLCDIVAIETSFLLAYWLRFFSPLTHYIPVVHGIPPLSAYIEGSLYSLPIWLWLFKRRGLYRQRRAYHFSDEFFVIIRIVFLAMLIMAGATFFYREFSYSRGVFILIAVVSTVFLSLERYLLLHFEQWWYRGGHDLKHVLIIGSGEIAQRLFHFFSSHPTFGYKVEGFIELSAKDTPLLQSILETIPEKIRASGVHTIILALNENDHALFADIVRRCDGIDVEIMFVPDILDVLTSQVKIHYFDSIPLLSIKTAALSGWNRIVKRLFDVLFSLVALVVLSPIFLLIMLLVRLDSRGPIFYLQERIGLDGKIFRVIKFRSMRVDAEKQTGPVWAQKDDPRTTRVGKFLRRFSLDELPQLVNVLKGDMSIVGPRPERPHFVEQFKREIPKYLDRHRVKTGMTGWAQVNGLRGNAPITERTQYDLYYVENWSLVFDIKIILKTLRAVLFGKDAY